MENLCTVQDFIRWTTSQFSQSEIYLGHGTDNPIDESKQLILGSLGLSLFIPPEFYNANLTNNEKQQLFDIIQKRIKDRVPTPYLINQAWFCGHCFYVDERVLIPRSPIGELINNQFRTLLSSDPVNILDLCTGSGCIGIACAFAFPKAQVDITDISLEALDVAQTNIELHEMDFQVIPIQSDLFNDIPPKKYDLIVSNPPYVDDEDMSDLPVEFLYEPKLALEAGFDGLDLVKRILNDAVNYLAPNGVLVCEVGNSWISLQKQYPNVPFNWIDFEHGGHGVFSITLENLIQYHDYFK
ncbi:ribosomal protein L3 N(5)-glutamine methyltransferase [Gilliamella sp. Choc4-2]|jgi:ribosomal protein L3 glutamine methyltransferase|uniref:50S ribosomal protein L3 N(5)-glutamine methyltransferase n=1 Tax=unclassified Gilliamella TaxID=2685620 RepID=UPI0004DD24C2|nr:50S ribosomal protein L3 N(5)-glutamine methyltransferase [Gilliamella apicola]KFA59674.1 Protein-N(5)-glutamine methyltransferase PrmB, methylates LSU ribosomal protein L3p [Gilliamella apicola]OCG30056.1 ribosomal protein L3 N(5)-glutamine methyltransferase [Gilliamella apicola]OCG43593.1 ribosomal protein L3 N(5)-glutamine methyltransferase [Gilliamella apicola]OCG53529.1 ribosomal protein L3 N(5)-glutamine methyltransferase [Gilliamella apicola]OCG64493.1 ribosomal protein L3 N(5)-gluta